MAQKKKKNETKKVDTSLKKSKAVAEKADVVKEKPKSVEKEATVAQKAPKKLVVSGKFVKFITWVLILFATFTVLDFVVQYINNDYSVAMVNGVRVPKSEFADRLEQAYGSEVVTQLVNEELIRQAAADAGVTVTKEDVDSSIAEAVEQLGGEEAYQEALVANGITEEDLRRDIEIQKLAERVIVPEPTDEELAAFFEENKITEDNQAGFFDEDDKFEDVKDDIVRAYTSVTFNQEVSSWLEQLKEDADIQNNVDAKPAYGLLSITRNLIEQLNNRTDK